MNPKLNRSEYKSTESYLFHLYNDLGCSDLKVACSFRKENGDTFWSKWLSFEELQHKDINEIVWKGYTRKRFLEIVSHRSVMDIEVMLDIDEDPFGSKKKEDIEKYSQNLCRIMKKVGCSFEAYFSGSKSYHISILFPQFRSLKKFETEEIKKKILKRVCADQAKFHVKSMIALEGVPHWKTGIIKQEVEYE